MSVAQPLSIGFVSFFFGNFRPWLRQDYLYLTLMLVQAVFGSSARQTKAWAKLWVLIKLWPNFLTQENTFSKFRNSQRAPKSKTAIDWNRKAIKKNQRDYNPEWWGSMTHVYCWEVEPSSAANKLSKCYNPPIRQFSRSNLEVWAAPSICVWPNAFQKIRCEAKPILTPCLQGQEGLSKRNLSN